MFNCGYLSIEFLYCGYKLLIYLGACSSMLVPPYWDKVDENSNIDDHIISIWPELKVSCIFVATILQSLEDNKKSL